MSTYVITCKVGVVHIFHRAHAVGLKWVKLVDMYEHMRDLTSLSAFIRSRFVINCEIGVVQLRRAYGDGF